MSRILLVGQHRVFRQCLARILRKSGTLTIVGQFEELGPAVAAAAQREAKVLLLDLNEPATELAELRRLREEGSDLRIIVLGLAESQDEILRWLEAGIEAYVPKESSLDELTRTVELVLRGETVCPPALAYSVFRQLGELGRRRRWLRRLEEIDLTARELEILHLLAEGLSNQKIADRLFLSVHTVKNHVHRILEKLDVHRREEAVAKAVRRRWVSRLPPES